MDTIVKEAQIMAVTSDGYTRRLLKTMRTIEHKNIPSRREQSLIQVQLIYSLPFATTMKKKKKKKKNDDDEKKDTRHIFKRGLPSGHPA